MFRLNLSNLHRSTRHWIFVITTVVMLILIATVWLNQDAEVQAKSNYMTSFRNTYPAISGTQLDNCSVCHTSIPSLNSYGADYRSHGHNLTAIELLDSDGDGYTNIQEIQAITFPGDAGSHPVQQPTATPTTPPTATPTTPPTCNTHDTTDCYTHDTTDSYTHDTAHSDTHDAAHSHTHDTTWLDTDGYATTTDIDAYAAADIDAYDTAHIDAYDTAKLDADSYVTNADSNTNTNADCHRR